METTENHNQASIHSQNLDLTVGIIHYRDPDAVVALLASLTSWSRLPGRVIIADNSADLVLPRTLLDTLLFPVKVLEMKTNLGYAGAANAVLRLLGPDGQFLLLLTQDAHLADDGAERLMAAAQQDSNIAVALPIIVYQSRPDVLFSSGGVLTKHGRTLHPGQGMPYDPAAWSQIPIRDVDWGDGAILLLRQHAVLEAGLFDETYFLYVEEVDLQHRIKQAGYRVVLVPQAVARQEPGPYSLYYKYRNLPRFTAKFRSDFRPWPWLVALPKDSYRMARLGRPKELLWALRGLLDHYRKRTGSRPSSILGKNGIS